MKKEKYIEDIAEIKKIMESSSRFMSLSGLSGVLAGTFALIAAYLAYHTIYSGQDYMEYRKAVLTTETLTTLILIASATIVLSLACGIWLTTRKARKMNQSIFDKQAQQMLINLAIPLVSGGIICFIILIKGGIMLVAPLTLVFYGLALVNASKYAVSSMLYLGLIEIALGTIAIYFTGYGLIFWAIGFGVMHIFYGIAMHLNDK